jgi:hypothetical protein
MHLEEAGKIEQGIKSAAVEKAQPGRASLFSILLLFLGDSKSEIVCQKTR